jgi:O-acetylhomoserine/O-acetylserine sulfhydrylase-like pyridoxal-dependent enzyme
MRLETLCVHAGCSSCPTTQARALPIDRTANLLAIAN